ncbi:hypothetical protein OEZ86_013130 [Tetradesmus obliquus]|nr:hypothetical protein OEZ86_013130 [Tetradesmus obliquus]
MTLSQPPRVAWNLRVLPIHLNKAFWSDYDRSKRLVPWDTQVALFFAFILCALSVNYSTKQGMDLPRLTKVFLIPLLYISAWLGTLLLAPAFYARHRTPIVLAVRLLTGYTAGSTSADTKDMIYTTMNLSDPLGFGLKISLIAMPPMMVVEVAVLQLPFLLQAAAVLYKCSRLMYGSFAAELWLELRAWVAAKLQLAASADASAWRAPATTTTSSSSSIVIDGMHISNEGLLSMLATKASELLLEPAPGLGGIAMLGMLHLSLLGLLSNLAMLAAHGVVYWLLPMVLNDGDFDAFYPLAPAA